MVRIARRRVILPSTAAAASTAEILRDDEAYVREYADGRPMLSSIAAPAHKQIALRARIDCVQSAVGASACNKRAVLQPVAKAVDRGSRSPVILRIHACSLLRNSKLLSKFVLHLHCGWQPPIGRLSETPASIHARHTVPNQVDWSRCLRGGTADAGSAQ